MIHVDINSDVGEAFGVYPRASQLWRMELAWQEKERNFSLATDEERKIFHHISSANVACGFHAGDPLIMDLTVAIASETGTNVGAHPSYPDLGGFGLRNMEIAPRELTALILYQLGALAGIARSHGIRLQHLKCHGALYNQAWKNEEISLAIIEAVRRYDPDLILLCGAGSALAELAVRHDLRTALEAFPERAYHTHGDLVSRSLPGAIIEDPDEIAGRAVEMVVQGEVKSIEGLKTKFQETVHSLCIHGDTPGAAAITEKVTTALRNAGVTVTPLDQVI